MTVLRDNKESLLAVLEAFVYDPLINWRLMQTEVEGRRNEGEQKFVLSTSLLDVCALVDPDRAAELARVAAHPQGPQRKLKANENDIFNGAHLHSAGYAR
jgi:FKBP12-rapamycin complex-associated protein